MFYGKFYCKKPVLKRSPVELAPKKQKQEDSPAGSRGDQIYRDGEGGEKIVGRVSWTRIIQLSDKLARR